MKLKKKLTVLISMVVLVSTKAFAQYSGHGTESVSENTLKKFAPPAVNVALKNKLQNYLDISSPGMGMLSNDKKTLYFSWRVTGTSQIWKIDGPKKFPIQLTSGTDAVTLNAVADNGQFLIISKDVNGEENPGLFRLDIKTGQVTELFRKPKVQSSFAFLTKDSQFMFFVANDKKNDSYNTYKMNIRTGAIETIFEGDGNWYINDQLNDGQRLLMVKYRGGRINEYWDFDTRTKKNTPIIGQNLNNEYEIGYGHKPDEYIVSKVEGDFKKLFVLKNGQLKLISDKSLLFDIDGFSVDHKREKIIYTINKNGYTELKAMSALTFKNLALPDFSKKLNKKIDHVFAGSTTKDGQITMLGVMTSQFPRSAFSYNWSTGQLTQWVVSSAPQVDLSQFVSAELMYYEARDKTLIPAFVRQSDKCKKEKNCKVIIHFHGGPEGQSQPGFSPYWQAFVDAGYVIVEPNVRGSTGYGLKWLDADNGPLRENVITDIEDAALWIKKNWMGSDGKPPKIGVMGGSYGGYSTLMAMTRFAGSFDVGVASVGMSNLISFLNNTASYRRVLRISEYGDPEKDKEALKKLSPITYVDQIKGPLMIIQGVNDPRVPAGEAIQMFEKIKNKGVPTALILFSDEGHGSAKKENQILEIGNTIEFFNKYL